MIRAQAPALWMFVSMFLMLLVATPACGGSKRTRTLGATLTAVNAARDGFVAWDHQHQQVLVEHASSRDDADKALADYHGKRAPVVAAFEVVYRAIAVAATQSDGPSLSAALDKAAQLYEALIGLGMPVVRDHRTGG